MTRYECILCNYSTEKRQYWYHHKKTKKHLKKIEEEKVSETDKNITETDKNITETDKNITETDKNITETDKNITETDKNITETEEKRPEIDDIKMYECPDCHKKFKQQHGYYRHRKHRCIGEENNMCEYCGKEYKKLKFLEKHELKCTKRPQILNQTINNTTINNIDNRQINNNLTINILPHGEEDFKRLLDSELIEYIKEHNYEDEFLELSKYVFKYFYLDIEEHKNIEIRNIRGMYCHAKVGDEMLMKRYKNIFDEKLYKLKCEFYNIRDRELRNFQLTLHNVANSIPNDTQYDKLFYKTKRELEQEYQVEMYNHTHKDD
jgi:hypothetical protein